MAGSVRVIVHSGEQGLEPAADYYMQFPWEPSPAGDMTLNKSDIVKLKDATLDTVLEAMAKAGAGGVVMLVCHAYREGLLMPLAKGARLPAGREAIARLLKVSAAQRKAKVIRALPSGTDNERKAKIDAWVKLTDELVAGSIRGDVTLNEVERWYEQWLKEFTRSELELDGGTLQRLVQRMEKVQSLRLDRVELRACAIGGSPDGMQAVKQLFACSKLLAPTVGTFYLKGVPVDTLDDFGGRYVREHRGTFRQPGPVGQSRPDPADFVIDVVTKNPGTRIFSDYQFGDIPTASPYRTPEVRLRYRETTMRAWRILAMIVEEIRPFWYRGSAATWHQASQHKPQLTEARKFVQAYVMPQAKYASGSLQVAGFWTPGEPVPWLLPNEPTYVDHIKQV
jgi:hypothetical protein